MTQRITGPVWTADVNVESLEVTLRVWGLHKGKATELHCRLEHPAGPRQLINQLAAGPAAVQLSGKGPTGLDKVALVVVDDEEAGEAMRLLARAEDYVRAIQQSESAGAGA